jgi:hypothetical protein
MDTTRRAVLTATAAGLAILASGCNQAGGAAGGAGDTQLNALLNRRPEEPIEIDTTLPLKPVPGRIDELIERAWTMRQEILQLAERYKVREVEVYDATFATRPQDALELCRLFWRERLGP